MTNRIPGRLEGSLSGRSLFVCRALEAVDIPRVVSGRKQAAPLPTWSVRRRNGITRELMRLECARQALEDEIDRLRELQSRKVS